MNSYFSIISTFSLILLGLLIPLFVFSVTLLGNAAERAKSEENEARKKQKKDFEIKINDTQNKINGFWSNRSISTT